MLSRVRTASLNGMEARLVDVETDITRGLPNMNIIGLGDATVKEAVARIRSSILSSKLEFPNERITINLAPAWLRKRGSHYDLGMGIGILCSTGQIPSSQIIETAFLGELSLSGKINRCNGIMPMVKTIRNSGIKKVIVPISNLEEASLVEGIHILGASTLMDVVNYLNGKENRLVDADPKDVNDSGKYETALDYLDIKGQEHAKRAVVIAASGGHGLMMIGSPGTGKTMIAERLPYIMPPLSKEEITELTAIYSIAGLLDDENQIITKRPFRNPGMSITIPGLLGAGVPPRPGEVTLAHKGVLFMDELGERGRDLIDCLRIPLESKNVSINRMGEVYRYPADFMFVTATNPCKCGHYGDPRKECTCSPRELQAYRSRISGPILGRIDIHVELMSPEFDDLTKMKGKSSEEMRNEILKAREIQKERYLKYKKSSVSSIRLNGELEDSLVDEVCKMSNEASKLFSQAYDSMNLEPRSATKIKKISRTIADLEGEKTIDVRHVAEALQYRERSR